MVVMAKRKVEVPQRARDCVTLADKISFSMMIREKLEALSNKQARDIKDGAR